MSTDIGELVKGEASYLVAATVCVATRTADMITTYLPLSAIDKIKPGVAHQAEENPILRVFMENMGIGEGIMVWSGVSIPLFLGVAYLVNKASKEKKLGNLILYLNSVGAAAAAYTNYQGYQFLERMGLP